LCFFNPPREWTIADPGALSSHVQVAFIKPRAQGFCPSINLAIEETSVSLSEYLKAVKGIHEQDRANQWRALGKVKTAAGMAQLTQIDTPSEWGPLRLLQLILIKDAHAYILTAAALKEEFSQFYQEIQSSFRSLNLTSDLFLPLSQLEQREQIKHKKEELINSLGVGWAAFEQEITSHSAEMGSYWQLLVLKEAQEELREKKRAADARAPDPS
jgi:hypothetical protein